ncbi:hypothetical protein KBC70_01960 [Candidatus Woesebacteria bacterium]|nr:hypothetical protein [Candidatus Woesebacteria bacterium]
MKKIAIIVFLLLITSISAYYYEVFCLKPGPNKTFLENLTLEFIGGFLLAVLVLIFGFFFQKGWEDKQAKMTLKINLKLLKKSINRLSKRHESIWNFSNEGPTFYFDGSRINQLYELLTTKDRYWEQVLIAYQDKSLSDDDYIVADLLKFLDQAEEALIIAERLDTTLKKQIIHPALAHKKESGFSSDRDHADIEAHLDYLVYRAAWINIDNTQILFGISPVVRKQINLPIIEGIQKKAEELKDRNTDLKRLVIQLNKARSNLIAILKKIQGAN